MSTPVLPPVLHIFRAVATAVVPEATELRPDAWAELEQTVERALQSRSHAMKRQLVTFIRLLEWLPLIKHGSRLTKMTPARRTAFLTTIQDSSKPLFRRGFWGLRTLIFLGYYTRPQAAEAISYRAHPDGWGHRRAATGLAAAGSEPTGEPEIATPPPPAPTAAAPRADRVDAQQTDLLAPSAPVVVPAVPVIVPATPAAQRDDVASRRGHRRKRR